MAVKLELDVGMLWLIPVGIALWFMIWALWNWRREERRKDSIRTRTWETPGHQHRSW